MPRHDQSRSAASRKTRKRGCSSSSSCSSSLVHGYRFKKAVVVSTPLWKTAAPVEEVWDVVRPVSARKLAATLWGMPSPSSAARRGVSKEKTSSRSSYPPHLSDPSHSPNSQRLGESRPGSVRRRTPTFAHRIKLNAAFETVTRSRRETPRGSTSGVRDRLKDVSNAIMTSKELLKIVEHVWGQEEQPSSSASLVSALHQELERARLQVDQLIHEQQHFGQTDVSRLIKQFDEEKKAWKVREREVVEAAIQSIAGELEGERRLRRRFENLNNKLGAELASLKGALQKATQQLESEKRTRQILEQVCDELAGNIGEDKAQLEQLKMESEKALEEVEKEREMLRLADLLREERVQMKLSEAKHQFEEKNAAVVKLKRDLENLLNPHKTKLKAGGSSQSQLDRGSSAEIAQFLDNIRFSIGDYEMEENDRNVEDNELDMNISNRSCRMNNGTAHGSKTVPVDDDDDDFGRRSISGRRSSRSSSLYKQTVKNDVQKLEHGRDRRRLHAYDYGDAMHMHKYPNVSRDLMYAGHPRESPIRFASPVRQWGQVRPPRDPHHAVSEMHCQAYSTGSKSRLSDARSETNSRRCKR
ncbi:unnamed protein product [Rhodiola kirilowii]